jgi:hypothetical protein
MHARRASLCWLRAVWPHRVVVHANVWSVTFRVIPAHADPSRLVRLDAYAHDAGLNVIAADAALGPAGDGNDEFRSVRDRRAETESQACAVVFVWHIVTCVGLNFLLLFFHPCWNVNCGRGLGETVMLIFIACSILLWSSHTWHARKKDGWFLRDERERFFFFQAALEVRLHTKDVCILL